MFRRIFVVFLLVSFTLPPWLSSQVLAQELEASQQSFAKQFVSVKDIEVPKVIIATSTVSDLSRMDWDQQVNASGTVVKLSSDIALALLNDVSESIKQLVRGYRDGIVVIDSKSSLTESQKAEQKLHKKQALQHLIAEELIKTGDLPTNYFELQVKGVIESADHVIDVKSATKKTDLREGTKAGTVFDGQLVNGKKPQASVDKKSRNPLTNVQDAQAWRNYYQERVEYLRSHSELPKSSLRAAEYAQDKFEDYLLKQDYIEAPNADIKTPGVTFKGLMKRLFGWLLPERAYAFIFGAEDFESCTSLPCSFTSNTSWGVATSSIDGTGQIEGAKSLKVVTGGEGSGSLTKSGLNASDIRVQFKIRVPDPITFGASDMFTILKLEDASGTDRLWLNVEDYGTPRLTIVGDALSYTDTEVDLIEGAVNTIELRTRVGTSTGAIQLWVNNNSAGSPDYDGGTAMNVGSGNFDKVVAGLVYAPESGVSTTYFDDITVDSAFIGASANGAPTGPSTSTINGLAYIVAHQNPDGSWGSATTSLLTTAAVLDTLHLLHATGTSYTNGVEWIDSYIADNNDYLAEQAKALLVSGAPTSTVETLIYALDDSTGGFVFDRGYEADPMTTAKALKALTAAGYEDLGDNPNLTISMALYYLTQSQRSDGAWGIFEGGARSISATGEAIEALLPYRSATLTGFETGDIEIEDYISDALSGLRNMQNSSGTWGGSLLNTAIAFYAMKSAGATPIYQNAAINYLQDEQDGNGSFGNDLYVTAKAVKALSIAPAAGAVGDAEVTDITPLTSLQTASSTTLQISVANHGDAPITSGILQVIADNYTIASIDLANESITISPSSTQNINLSLPNTVGFVGDVAFTVYLEGSDGIGYPDSRYDETLAFAEEPSELPGLPIFFIAQKHVASDSPALNVRWAYKEDPNRLEYLIMWRTVGSSTWDMVPIDNTWNGAFLWPFTPDQPYEVTVGAVAQDDTRYVYYDNAVEVITSSSTTKYATSTISGSVSVAGQPLPDVSLWGYSVAGTSDESGDYFIEDIRYGASAFYVDDFRYEPFRVRFDNEGGDLSGIKVPTLLQPDTENPVVINLAPYVFTSYEVPNKTDVTFHYTVSDDVGYSASGTVQSAKFEYYDPHTSDWHLIGTQEGLISNTWTYHWTIPENLLGEDYQMRVTVRDFSGKDSTPAVYGPFEIVEGDGAPTFSFMSPNAGSGDQSDLSYTIKWTAHDPDDNATIYFYYDVDQDPNNANSVLIATRHTDDLLTQYEWDTSAISEGTYYVRAVVTDSYNTAVIVNSSQITIAHYAPTTPTSLHTQGVTDPENIFDTDAKFSAIFNDPNSTSTAGYYRIQVATSTAFSALGSTPVWDSGKVGLSTSTPTAQGERLPNINATSSLFATSTTYYWRIKLWDNSNNEGAWSNATSSFSLAGSNSVPTAPTSLLVNGQTDPTNVTSTAPKFSAIYNDPNGGDRANDYRIQVSTSSAFASVFWDSATSTMTTSTAGSRSPDITYGGSTLSADTTYYWRMSFVDIWGGAGAWSTTTSTFSTAANNAVEISDGSVIGLWHLDSDSSDSTTHDYDGSDTNVSYASGKLGNAASLNGSNSKIDLPNFTSTDTTFIAWIKTNTGGAPFIHLGNGSPQQMLWLDTNGSGNIRFAEYNGGYSDLTTAWTNYADNAWHLVIGTRSGNTVCVYADDVYKGCSTLSPSTNVGGDKNAIGYDRYNVASYYSGLIDEVALVNTVITTSTRSAIWNSGTGKVICVTSGCGSSGGGIALPSISSGTLQQYATDATTTVAEGGTVSDGNIVFKGMLLSSATNTLQLQIEVQPASSSFTGILTVSSTAIVSGVTASTTISVADLSDGNYHWRARAVDMATNASSSWQEFGTIGNTDFIVAHATGVAIASSSIIGLWHLDGDSTDSSGHGRNGSDTSMSYATGKLSNAGSFSGSGAKIDLPSFTSTDTTFIAWIKTNAGGTPFIHLGNGSPQQMLWLDTDGSGNIRFAEYNGGYSDLTTSGTNYANNAWHLVIGTRSGNTVCVYADDVYKGCGTLSPSTDVGGDKNAIGYDKYNNTSYFNGLIDEVALLNIIVTTSTRNALWNSGSGEAISVIGN